MLYVPSPHPAAPRARCSLVRSLEPLAPGLRSLHLLSWNMDGLQLPTLEPLCFSAFTSLSSLTVANRITQDAQVGGEGSKRGTGRGSWGIRDGQMTRRVSSWLGRAGAPWLACRGLSA